MSLSQNRIVINRMFKALPKAVDDVTADAFRKLLDAGVQYCLDAHDAGMSHLDMGEGYGWVLLHNGREIDRKLIMKGHLKGYAGDALNQAKRGLGKTSGWVGIVLASMKPAVYFKTNLEFIFMRRGVAKMSSEDFTKYFKQVTI